MKFMQDHKETFNKHEEIRDDAYWKATRYYEIVKLYEQVLNETPVYVPKKFRRDKYHIMSTAELEILQRREENDLKSEIEVFKLREERNRKKVELQDDLITIFVNEHVQNPYLKEAILRDWNDKNRKEMERVTQVWRGKIKGVKKAFDKDREYIRKHNHTRVKHRETEMTPGVENPTKRNPSRVTPLPNAEVPVNLGNGTITAESEQPNENDIVEVHSVTNEDARENYVNIPTRDEALEADEAEQEEPNARLQDNALSETSRHSNTVNDRSSKISETASSLQQHTETGSVVLEDVESDENFTDEELSQVLFDETVDIRIQNDLVTLADDTSDDDTDDEANGDQQDFQKSYHLRKKIRKPRSSYSPQVVSQSQKTRRQQQEQQQQQHQHQQQEHQEQQQEQRQQQSQQRKRTQRPRSSTSRTKTSHQHR